MSKQDLNKSVPRPVDADSDANIEKSAPEGVRASHDGEASLSDEQRVKVLSPAMMVFKRFIRNRLAITGLVILVIMFLFSFLGGVLSPYRQDQVFRKYEYTDQDYASATFNSELRYVAAQGETFSKAAYAQLILARNNDRSTFDANGVTYTFTEPTENFVSIERFVKLASVTGRKGIYMFAPIDGAVISDDLQAAYTKAALAKQDDFEFDGGHYFIVAEGKESALGQSKPVAMASMLIFDTYDSQNSAFVSSYEFRFTAEKAIHEAVANGQTSAAFEIDGARYTVTIDDSAHGQATIYLGDDTTTPFAAASDMIVNALSKDVFLTPAFKTLVSECINNGEASFTYPNAEGSEVEYRLNRVHETYSIRTEKITQLIDMYSPPSQEHLLGTDSNGMDLLTRLMYGGRISLMVGFVVILIEIAIGVIIGGVSGYFGGWVDTLLMRFVDLFNSIPYWPMIIIGGAMMDMFEVDPYLRIFMLMLILGLMGWTSVARVVRGQILALREQDFMIAAEATGISVKKRIFRHLVPNVMPLLIVQATMGLGSIIITEATLSFLGLGVKYPLASWGSIINAATNLHVMTNYWFIWIPAGMLILITVLGFNFVGDGLRDAFDPKMKR